VRGLKLLFVIGILLGNPFGIIRAQWTTHFDDICALGSWLDIQESEGWNIQALETHDISVTHPGYFTMMLLL